MGKILIADASALICDTLADYVARAVQGADVVTAQDFMQAMTVAKSEKSMELVLLSLCLPSMNGLNGLVKFINKFPKAKVGIVADLAKPIDVYQAMEKGACGYFSKTMDGLDFIAAINDVLAGEIFIPQCVSSKEDNEGAQGGFTPREMSVIENLSKGLSNKIIANELDIQEVTVKMHLRNICAKLEVTNRTQAILKVMELGILPA